MLLEDYASVMAPATTGIPGVEISLGTGCRVVGKETQGDLEITPAGGYDQHDRPTARVRLNGEDVGDKMVAASLAQRHGAARDLCPQSGYMNAWENQDEMNRVNRAHFGR